MTSSKFIDYIRKSSKKFINEHHKDEVIYFDNIWEIYELELRKRINKPPEKWRFKVKRSRLMGALGFSDDSQTEELVTPKIIKILLCALIQLTKKKNHASLERIEEVISTCGEELTSSIRLQAVNYFAPLLIQDLRKLKVFPGKEKKREYVKYSNVGRKELNREEYQKEKKVDNSDYLIWINEVAQDFFINGHEQIVEPISKRALVMLIKNEGEIVTYKKLFEQLSSTAYSDDYLGWSGKGNDDLENINTVHRWFSYLRNETTLSKEKWNEIVINIPRNISNGREGGYKFRPKGDKKYCLIDYLS